MLLKILTPTILRLLVSYPSKKIEWIEVFETMALPLDEIMDSPVLPPLIKKTIGGSITTYCVIEEDRKNGQEISFYSNGIVAALNYYKEGLLHGPAKTFSQEGKCLYEGIYIDGGREGIFKSYYRSGQLYSEQEFCKDKAEGEHIYYYASGSVHIRENFYQGLYHGENQILSVAGEVLRRETFSFGCRVDLNRTSAISQI